MRMLKKGIWLFKQKRMIRYFDCSAPIGGPIAEKGHYLIKNYFSEGELDLIVSALTVQQKKNKASDCEIKIDNPLLLSRRLCRIFFDEKIIDLVKSYLGEKARFDFCNSWRIIHNKNSIRSSSNEWHHDCVGHRLKFFILLNKTNHSKGQKTFYIDKSNLNKYSTYATYGDGNNRVDQAMVKNKDYTGLSGEKGDILIFDTNGLHRGNYDDGIEDRDVIQLEFSDKTKGSYLSGDIGPRKSLLPNLDYKGTLIDLKKLRKENDYLKYG